MRERFDTQLQLGTLLIEDTPNAKGRSSLASLVIALREIYKHEQYRDKILAILEEKIIKGKKRTGRPGMNLWIIFVLAQVRLNKGLSYDDLHMEANYNQLLRQVMGVASEHGFASITFSYQSIVDNVNLLSDEDIKEINKVIISFGHREVFKKKETEALRLKTDSFVSESNVHFPTDYNLLWDCIRKCLDVISSIEKKYGHQVGWRKMHNWRKELKGLMRSLGRTSNSGGKHKEERIKEVTSQYIHKSLLLSKKIRLSIPLFPFFDVADLSNLILLEHYCFLLDKHIDLLERRIIKGEKIPQEEKLFSIFEPYTEWITKGKLRPSVELGKKVNITTDQYQLIVDYEILSHQSDSSTVISLADRLTPIFKIGVWSFDKGYWHPENRALLEMMVPEVIMPKKGKCTQSEKEREHSKVFKKYRNKHSAVESNIHSLGIRGLSHCPDKGASHFNRYVGLGVCAYNLCCIGRKLQAAYKNKELHFRKAS